MSGCEIERHFEWGILLASGDVLDEDKPFATEGEALQALERERKHLRAYGVGEEYLPMLVRREIVLTTGSWGIGDA